MNSPAIPWDGVRLFLALHRTPTLRAAAKKLQINATTASRQLEQLELALGGVVFDRTRRGLEPTALAARILPNAEAMESALLALETRAAARETAIEGTIRLTAPPGIASTFVPMLLRDLHREHPRLRFEIASTTTILDLERREADLALRTIRPTHGDLVMTKLVSSRQRLLATRALAKKLGTLRSFDDAPWVGWSTQFAQHPFARWQEERVADSAVVVRSDAFEVQLESVVNGFAIGLFSEEFQQLRPLVPVKLTRALEAELAKAPLGEVYLVAHRELRQVPRVAAAWDFLSAKLSGAAPPRARARRVSR